MAIDVIIPNLKFDSQTARLVDWLKRDPILILKARMIAEGQLDETELKEMMQQAV